jgi:hypothetical protein
MIKEIRDQTLSKHCGITTSSPQRNDKIPAARMDKLTQQKEERKKRRSKAPCKQFTNLLFYAPTGDTGSLSWMHQYDLFPSDTESIKQIQRIDGHSKEAPRNIH